MKNIVPLISLDRISHKFRFMPWRRWLACILALLSTFLCQSAFAVPSFARQTGQSCVACHAGGMYPELTPYGRMFKLTGYTMGEHGNPLSAMVLVGANKSQNNSDSSGNGLSPLDGQAVLDFASIFVAGKATDNIGGFAQYSYTFHDTQDTVGNWQGHFVADNFDLRYADRRVDDKRDMVWGLTLHNNPTVQDVWNSTPAWGYPYVSTTNQGINNQAAGAMPAGTFVEGALAQQVAGIGGYLYWNKSIYAELTSYRTATGGWSFLSYGSNAGDTNHPLTFLDGNALYWRLAYTHDWGAHNIMVGAFGLDGRTFPNDGNTNMPIRNSGNTHYQDTGIDGQYQYLMAPHTVTAHVRMVQERINDGTLQVYSDGPATLNTRMIKGGYVYNNKYGASLAYTSVRGSADSTAYASSANLLPDSDRWTPEFFWIPLQNLRIGLQFNKFTRYMGATSNYDGNGRNPSDNNTTYAYLWLAF